MHPSATGGGGGKELAAAPAESATPSFAHVGRGKRRDTTSHITHSSAPVVDIGIAGGETEGGERKGESRRPRKAAAVGAEGWSALATLR